MVVIIMGVSGVGKTTVGRRLAGALGVAFVDADDLHDPVDLARMARGRALTDAERRPWLSRVHHELLRCTRAGRPGVVLACSALRQAYRTQLAEGIAGVQWVHLVGDPTTIRQRLADRHDGVGPELLESQLATLEPPVDAIVVDVDQPSERVVEAVLSRLVADPGR